MQDGLVVVGAIGAVLALVIVVVLSVRNASKKHDVERALSKVAVDANGQFVFRVSAQEKPIQVFFRFDLAPRTAMDDAYGLAVLVETRREGPVNDPTYRTTGAVETVEWLVGLDAVGSPNVEARKVQSLEAPLEGATRVAASFVLADVPARSTIEVSGRVRASQGTTLSAATVYVPGET